MRAVAIGSGTVTGGIHLRSEDGVVFHRYRLGTVRPSLQPIAYEHEHQAAYEARINCAVIGVI